MEGLVIEKFEARGVINNPNTSYSYFLSHFRKFCSINKIFEEIIDTLLISLILMFRAIRNFDNLLIISIFICGDSD